MNNRLAFIFIPISLFLNVCSFAQSSNQEERAKIIELSTHNFKGPGSLPFPISDIEVLVSLWDTSRLGYVQVGVANKKIKAVLNETPQKALQTFVNEQYKSRFTTEGKKLLWVVQDLRINERTTMSGERAFVYLHADAYVTEKGDLYSYITTIDTVLERSGIDVTSKHGKNIAEAFNLLFIQSLNANSSISTTFTKEQMARKATERFAIPALQDSLKQGLYTTFEDFKNNRPAIDSFVLRNDKKKVTICEVKPDGSQVVLKKPWGIVYKGELYRYFNGDLIALEKMGNSFVISDYLEAANRRNKSIFWGAIAGGFTGGLIGGVTGVFIAPSITGSSSTKTFEVTGFPYLKGMRPEASAINMQNGKLIF